MPAEFTRKFAPLAERFGMRWRLELSALPHRVALFVSKYDHCLVDLLYRHQSGELPCEIPLVVSNHPDAKRWADFYGVPFHLVPVEAGNKAEAERQATRAAARAQDRPGGAGPVHAGALAGVRGPLSRSGSSTSTTRSCRRSSGRSPYHRAFERGVKLIGATSHYVTEDLDEGPIIEQDVVRVSHRDGLDDLLQKGRDLEKVVLSRAVRWHIDHRILVYERKTVIFD